MRQIIANVLGCDYAISSEDFQTLRRVAGRMKPIVFGLSEEYEADPLSATFVQYIRFTEVEMIEANNVAIWQTGSDDANPNPPPQAHRSDRARHRLPRPQVADGLPPSKDGRRGPDAGARFAG